MSDPNRNDDVQDWRSPEAAAVAATMAELGRRLDALAAAVEAADDEHDEVVDDATALILDVPIALAMYSTQILSLAIKPSDEVRRLLEELEKYLQSDAKRKHETLSRMVGILRLQTAHVHNVLAARADNESVH